MDYRMMELVKNWNDGSGDELTATYQGENNGDASFSSVTNEGLDRTIGVAFKIGENVYAERNVLQDGLREIFNASDGDFFLVDGGTFNVLKGGGGSENVSIAVIFDDNDTSFVLASDGGDNSWIKGRRCLAKPQSDGSVSICYLDENNSELYYDGATTADLSGAQGQWMVDIPEFYMDESEDGKHILHLSPNEVEGWKHSRRVLVGVTKAVNVDGVLWSRKAVGGEIATKGLSSRVFHNYAAAIGSGWDMIDYETHCKIGHLFYAKYLNKDCQTVIGRGENNNNRILGTTSTLGNNDGTTDTQISFLGIEDAWGGSVEKMSGMHHYGTNVYIYDGFEPVAGAPTVEYRVAHPYGDNGVIVRYLWGENADMLPAATGAESYTTDYLDYYGKGYNLSGVRVYARSGRNYSLSGGVGYLSNDHGEVSTDATWGTRIQYRGTINVVNDITTFENL